MNGVVLGTATFDICFPFNLSWSSNLCYPFKDPTGSSQRKDKRGYFHLFGKYLKKQQLSGFGNFLVQFGFKMFEPRYASAIDKPFSPLCSLPKQEESRHC